MENKNFGKRLRLARKKSGLSLRALSEKLKGKVSHTAISRYEKGEMMPGSTVLIQLSQALDVSLDFLFRKTIETPSLDFRKHSNLSKKEEERVVSTVQDSLERYIEAASSLVFFQD